MRAVVGREPHRVRCREDAGERRGDDDEAARRDEAVAVEACRLQKNPNVALRIEELRDLHRKRHEVTVDRVIAEYAKLAFLDIRKAFDALYEHRYAHHSPEEPVEMVNVRLAMVGKRPKLKFPTLKRSGKVAPLRRRPVYLGNADRPVNCPVYARPSLPAAARIAGPALIEEHGTTTVLYPGDACRVAPSGELIVTLGGRR